MKQSEMSPRIKKLREKMLSEPRYASIEQARIITATYKSNETKPRMIQRALALKAALVEMEIRIEPGELIVGNRTAGVRAGVVFPESGSTWVDSEFEDLPNRPQDKFNIRADDVQIFRNEIKPYWAGKSLEDVLKARYGKQIAEISKVAKINQTDHAQGHICPDCKLWLKVGAAGLKAQAAEKLQTATGDKKVFYEGISIAMDGVQNFMKRYALLAANLAKLQPDEISKRELEQVAKNCNALAERPPQTFWEAVQSIWFLFVVLQMESNASSFSPGRMDEFLIDFYRRDVENKTLTENHALEILECLWLKFNQIVYMRNRNSAKFFAGFPIGFNIAIGGQDSDGNDYVNEVSFLCLKAQEHLLLP